MLTYPIEIPPNNTILLTEYLIHQRASYNKYTCTMFIYMTKHIMSEFKSGWTSPSKHSSPRVLMKIICFCDRMPFPVSTTYLGKCSDVILGPHHNAFKSIKGKKTQ